MTLSPQPGLMGRYMMNPCFISSHKMTKDTVSEAVPGVQRFLSIVNTILPHFWCEKTCGTHLVLHLFM